jgi:hypothetical protein
MQEQQQQKEALRVKQVGWGRDRGGAGDGDVKAGVWL